MERKKKIFGEILGIVIFANLRGVSVFVLSTGRLPESRC